MLRSFLRRARVLLTSNQMWSSVPLRAVLGVSLTATMVVAGIGYADVVRVDPRIVVVEKDSTAMRCGSGTPMYQVGTLKAGQLLRVDGEEDGWLRVEYLTGMLAFVKAEDATLEPDGQSVRLNRPSRLAAVNERDPERGHWWSLLDSALSADTCLRVHETVKAMNEVTTGYLVVAPASARGFVKADTVREATKEEALAFQGRTDVESAAVTGSADGQEKAKADGGTGAVENAGLAEVVHDMDSLKARYTQVMALKGDAAREQIPVVIAEFKRTAASLGPSKEDRLLRSAIDRGISALQLRQDILSTLKTYS